MECKNQETGKFNANRKNALRKAKVARGTSVVFYTIGLAAVVALGRKYSLQNIDIDLYIKDSLAAVGVTGMIGAIAKYKSRSYEKEADEYSDIVEEDHTKKLIR